jgi:hypothetical protein
LTGSSMAPTSFWSRPATMVFFTFRTVVQRSPVGLAGSGCCCFRRAGPAKPSNSGRWSTTRLTGCRHRLPKNRLEPLQDPPGLPVDPDVEKAKAEAEAKEQELIDALARLDPIAYARRRKKAAEELGNDESGDDIPVGALDRAVGRAGRRSSTKLRLRRPICRLRITAIG